MVALQSLLSSLPERLALVLLLAFLLDLLLGDPRWIPHPVRAIGLMAGWLERLLRRGFSSLHLAGLIAVFIIVVVFGCSSGMLVWLSLRFSELAGLICAAIIIYTTIAPHDLAMHSRRVATALRAQDTASAREAVSMIVGRDTAVLDEKGIIRATLESVGENLVDGVTAALFWAIVGGLIAGPFGAVVGAVVYRAVNTLDAIYGYRNEQYREFGLAAARLDDIVNYLPARLTVIAASIAAMLIGCNGWRCLRIALRDGRKHSSPNSGFGEAALAGALGVVLGGPTCYQGEWKEYPEIGESHDELSVSHIEQANRFMFLTTFVFLILGLLVIRFAHISCC